MLNKICLAVKQRARTFFSSIPTSGAVSSINTPINSQPRWCHLRIPVVSSGSLLHKRPALYHVTHANYHCCLAATSHSQATCQDQEAAQRFTHSLSEEQAAAALAGDGHLRYNQAPGDRTGRLTTHLDSPTACAIAAHLYNACADCSTGLSSPADISPCTTPTATSVLACLYMSDRHVYMHQDHSWTWQRQDTGLNFTSGVPDQGERLQAMGASSHHLQQQGSPRAAGPPSCAPWADCS